MKNFYGRSAFPEGNGLYKILRVMRIVIFLFLLGVNQICATNVFSQNQLVSLRFDKISLEQLLWEIQKQTDIVFMYGQEDIKGIRDLKIDVDNSEAIDVIKSCIKGTGVEMKIVDNVVVLMMKEPDTEGSDQQDQRVTGMVMDEDGNPLPGATVMIKGSFKGVTADDKGGAAGCFIYRVPNKGSAGKRTRCCRHSHGRKHYQHRRGNGCQYRISGNSTGTFNRFL